MLLNLASIERVESHLLGLVDGRKTSEDLLRELCNDYEIDISQVYQYFLMNTVLMSYLSSLKEKGDLNLSVVNNVLYWERT